MQTKPPIIFGSLVGAGVVYAVLAACGTSRTKGRPSVDLTDDARAQTTTSCSSWQTAVVFQSLPIDGDYSNFQDFPTNQALGVTAIPAGWEPTQTEFAGGTASQMWEVVHVRKCTSQ